MRYDAENDPEGEVVGVPVLRCRDADCKSPLHQDEPPEYHAHRPVRGCLVLAWLEGPVQKRVEDIGVFAHQQLARSVAMHQRDHDSRYHNNAEGCDGEVTVGHDSEKDQSRKSHPTEQAGRDITRRIRAEPRSHGVHTTKTEPGDRGPFGCLGGLAQDVYQLQTLQPEIIWAHVRVLIVNHLGGLRADANPHRFRAGQEVFIPVSTVQSRQGDAIPILIQIAGLGRGRIRQQETAPQRSDCPRPERTPTRELEGVKLDGDINKINQRRER
ncbi:hypothetical protein N7519_006846 [Penicillium mononematosum]|uniref:uncharacterized protein n=1 Tax=Penicillium mononematosum TaxID=268346 RepID=UPI002547776C|nr:uncharacterized protein N7519_006846 [Penicillium mononematosum]KAJ6185545.1 hypothetical protein N7519_006846 [Penicillium mononematosum]